MLAAKPRLSIRRLTGYVFVITMLAIESRDYIGASSIRLRPDDVNESQYTYDKKINRDTSLDIPSSNLV